MKRTLEEKYNYNKKKKGLFSGGYCEGVDLYIEYQTSDEFDRRLIKTLVNNEAERAKMGKESAKGFMCGYRDAANERKNKYKNK